MSENKHYVLLDRQTVTASQNGSIIDMLAHSQLNMQGYVHVAGSAGNIILEHAGTTDPNAFQTLTTKALTSTGVISFESISSFMRYVRWVSDANVAGGPPVVSLWITAKSA